MFTKQFSSVFIFAIGFGFLVQPIAYAKKADKPTSRPLAGHGAHSPKVRKLIQQLQDEDKQVRVDAAWALGRMGKEARPAIPALTGALKDKEQLVRYYAALALGWMGKEARSAIPALIPLLKDKDEEVAKAAQQALQQIKK